MGVVNLKSKSCVSLFIFHWKSLLLRHRYFCYYIISSLYVKMFETSLYHDEILGNKDNARKLKRNMTLDLNPFQDSKKKKMNCLLSSPDLKMLQLASPELERFIMQNTNLANATLTTPSSLVFPKSVTKEQEEYARGFCIALEKLHSTSDENSSENGSVNANYTTECKITTDCSPISVFSSTNPVSTVDTAKFMSLLSGLQNSLNNPVSTCDTINTNSSDKIDSKPLLDTLKSSSMLSFSSHFTNSESISNNAPTLDTFYANNVPLHLKEEPQTVPCNTPPISPAPSSCDLDVMPINMNEQETIKRERKKERNREAARKCRSRKLERISCLEDKIKEYKSHISSLNENKDKLMKEITQLKQVIMIHNNTGCTTLKPLLQELDGHHL